MNWKIAVALVCGLITAVLIYLWTDAYRNEQVAYAFLRLKPDVKIARGQAVTPDMLGDPAKLPESFGSLVSLAIPSGASYREWLKDRTAATDIPPGAVLMFQYFDDRNGGRLTTMISPGKRALTLPVNAPEAVGHFVEPGSRVDIVGTVEEPVKPVDPAAGTPAAAGPETANQGAQPAPGTEIPPPPPEPTPEQLATMSREEIEALANYRKQMQDYSLGLGNNRRRVVTRTFLQNVRVLAVGTATTSTGVADRKNAAYSHVTVEVTPAEAEMLIFALGESRGRLNLVLRNPTDDAVEPLPSVNWTRM
jgi:Flp pilus assembly protein CpaB